MGIPEHSESVVDGNLQFSGESTSKVWAVIGACSGGNANQLYTFRDPSSLVATLGYGPAVELLALLLEARRGTIYFVKPTLSVAGASSVPAASGGGPAVTLSVATARDNYQGIVEIRKAGAVGTSTFRYSLDGGDTWSPDIATAATYAIPNSGLTLAFAVGAYVKDERYTWTSTAPAYSTSDFNTAFDILANASGVNFSVLSQVGCPDGAADGDKVTAWAGFASAVETKLDARFTAHQFIRAIIDPANVPDDAATDTLISAAFLSVAAERTATLAGFCELKSPISLRTYKRPATWPAAVRLWSIPLGEDPAWVGRGPLPAGVSSLYHDEDRREVYDAMRIGSLRTIKDLTGFYITNMPLLSAAGSDFKYIHHGLLIDEACRLARKRMLPRLSQRTRYYPNPAPTGKVAGAILEQEAVSIERSCQAALRDGLVNVDPPACQDAEVIVNRTQNILSTEELPYDVKVQPFAYPKKLSARLGFKPLT